MSRVIGYRYEGRFLNFKCMDALLARAKEQGIVTEYDHTVSMDPGMSCVWFNGRPGKELRAVRDAVAALVER